MMIMPEGINSNELIEHAGRGFLEGMGIDALSWIAAGYFPDLGKSITLGKDSGGNPVPLRIPGYDQNGIHGDDLIPIIASAAVIATGAGKNDMNTVAEGVAMWVGHYFLSKHQGTPPYVAAAKIANIRSADSDDLVRVD